LETRSTMTLSRGVPLKKTGSTRRR
jgi:hypothetical protein